VEEKKTKKKRRSDLNRGGFARRVFGRRVRWPPGDFPLGSLRKKSCNRKSYWQEYLPKIDPRGVLLGKVLDKGGKKKKKTNNQRGSTTGARWEFGWVWGVLPRESEKKGSFPAQKKEKSKEGDWWLWGGPNRSQGS